MIAFESPLRRLPVGLDRKQSLLLDGIRHAAEIATLAYERLLQSLTVIAQGPEGDVGTAEDAQRGTAAYLDAWAIVDAIDRLRTLVRLLPSASEEAKARRSELELQLQDVRAVRNVADHLAQRLDHVVAHGGAALGVLTWTTLTEGLAGRYVVLLPGSLHGQLKAEVSNPAGKSFRPPTDFITLRAGAVTASISHAYEVASEMVASVEKGLQQAVEQHGLQGQHLGADATLFIDVQWFELDGTPAAKSPAEK